jgi:branched-chain amino acid transport system substrate-binding protein
MKKVSTLTLVSLLIVMALVLAGCPTPPPAAPAGGETTTESEGETATPAEEEAAEGGEAAAMECTDAIGCAEIAPDEPIHIAYLLTISGATAFLGEDSRGGIEIAIDDRGGELLGHEIELTGEDSLCSAEGGQTAAQKVASDPTVIGAIGTSCSSAGEAALPIISQAGLVMISPSNTAPRLTNDNPDEGGTWQPGYYRTAHNDLFQGRVAAEYAYNELGARTAATIHDGSPYADGLQEVFANTMNELGGEVTFQGAVNVGDTDMRPILTEIAANPPDILYFPIFEPEGDFIAAQSTEIPGLEETILMGADGLLSDSFPEGTGEAAIGMYLSGPYISGDRYNEFLTSWEEKFGGAPPSGFHAHAYDATNMLLNAIEQVAQQGEDGTLLIGRQALRDALSATANFDGLTGTLTCGPTGDCATGEALGIYQITEAEVSAGNWPPAVVWTP